MPITGSLYGGGFGGGAYGGRAYGGRGQGRMVPMSGEVLRPGQSPSLAFQEYTPQELLALIRQEEMRGQLALGQGQLALGQEQAGISRMSALGGIAGQYGAQGMNVLQNLLAYILANQNRPTTEQIGTAAGTIGGPLAQQRQWAQTGLMTPAAIAGQSAELGRAVQGAYAGVRQGAMERDLAVGPRTGWITGGTGGGARERTLAAITAAGRMQADTEWQNQLTRIPAAQEWGNLAGQLAQLQTTPTQQTELPSYLSSWLSQLDPNTYSSLIAQARGRL